MFSNLNYYHKNRCKKEYTEILRNVLLYIEALTFTNTTVKLTIVISLLVLLFIINCYFFLKFTIDRTDSK